MDYRHDALPKGPFFRLLHVEYDSKTKQPIVHFEIANLECEPPNYIAISYAWEDATPVQRILYKDGRYIWLSETLSGLFATLGKQHDTLTLWIDALCIHQNDVEERGHQVNLMKQIYSSAQCVIIWLGLGSRETDRIFDSCQGEMESRTPLDHEVAALMKVFKRTWFTRLWVVQEAIVSKTVLIMCGNRRMGFDTLGYMVWSLWSTWGVTQAAKPFLTEREAPYAGLRCATRILALRESFWCYGAVPLEDVLEMVFLCCASDSRDFVFAISGIIDRSELLPLADYGVTPENLFVDTTIRMLTNARFIDLLALCGTGPRTLASQLSELEGRKPLFSVDATPSWVLEPRLNSFDEPFTAARVGSWDAGGSFEVNVLRVETSNLHLRAKVVDFVDNVGPALNTWRIPALKLCLNQSVRLTDQQTALEALTMNLQAHEDEVPLYGAPSISEWKANPNMSDEFDELRKLLNRNETLSRIRTNEYFQVLGRVSRRRCRGWRIFNTERQYFGMSWRSIEKGDVICVVSGCKLPLLIRPLRGQNARTLNTIHGRLVGWCYLHGIMHGEALCEGLQTKTMVLT